MERRPRLMGAYSGRNSAGGGFDTLAKSQWADQIGPSIPVQKIIHTYNSYVLLHLNFYESAKFLILFMFYQYLDLSTIECIYQSFGNSENREFWVNARTEGGMTDAQHFSPNLGLKLFTSNIKAWIRLPVVRHWPGVLNYLAR
jgi:hypothetical protein